MAKQKSNTRRFSEPMRITTNPKKIKRIKSNLNKLIAMKLDK